MILCFPEYRLFIINESFTFLSSYLKRKLCTENVTFKACLVPFLSVYLHFLLATSLFLSVSGAIYVNAKSLRIICKGILSLSGFFIRESSLLETRIRILKHNSIHLEDKGSIRTKNDCTQKMSTYRTATAWPSTTWRAAVWSSCSWRRGEAGRSRGAPRIRTIHKLSTNCSLKHSINKQLNSQLLYKFSKSLFLSLIWFFPSSRWSYSCVFLLDSAFFPLISLFLL